MTTYEMLMRCPVCGMVVLLKPAFESHTPWWPPVCAGRNSMSNYHAPANLKVVNAHRMEP